MFPYIGHEFIAALLERPAKKPDSVLMRRPSKRHDGTSTRPSLRAFYARHMKVLKAHWNAYFFKQREKQATTKPMKIHISQMERSNLPRTYRVTTDSPPPDDSRRDTKGA
jgi:hypothetical protein